MTDQTAASPEAKPADRGPLTMEQAVAQTLERYRSAAAPPAAEPAEAAATATTNAEQDESEQADGVDQEQSEEQQDEQAEESTADDGTAVELDDNSKIVLPDGSEWTAKELVEGTLRLKDYTKKTQAVAEDRRALEAQAKEFQDKASRINQELVAALSAAQEEAKAAKADRERYSAQVAKIAEAQKSTLARWSGVDWDKLQADDPVKASQLFIQYQRDREAMQVIEAEQRELESKSKAELEAEKKKAEEEYARSWHQQRLALHEHVKAKHPILADPEKGNAEWNAMATTLKGVGLTDEVIQAAMGARHDPSIPLISPPIFELIRKATLYDQAHAQHSKAIAPAGDKPKATTDGKIRVVKAEAPRFRPPPAEKAALGRAQAQFNRTGSFKDAHALELAKLQARAGNRAG